MKSVRVVAQPDQDPILGRGAHRAIGESGRASSSTATVPLPNLNTKVIVKRFGK